MFPLILCQSAIKNFIEILQQAFKNLLPARFFPSAGKMLIVFLIDKNGERAEGVKGIFIS